MAVMTHGDPDTRARLAAELKELKAQVGGPSFRVMAALLAKAHEDPVSATTLRDAATPGAPAPRPVTVFQFVTACRLLAHDARPDMDPACFDLDGWYARWKQIGAPPDPAAATQLAGLRSVVGESNQHSMPAEHSRDFAQYLAPSLLSALLASILNNRFGLNAQIGAAALVVAWMGWTALRDSRLPWIRRAALPTISVAYTATLIGFIALPSAPPLLQTAIPAALWIAAASITLRLIESEHQTATASQYVGVATIGAGVAVIEMGVSRMVDSDRLLGVAAIGAGVAVIGMGVSRMVDSDRLFGVAAIGVGAAVIGGGVAAIMDSDRLLGVAAIGAGLAVIGGGVATIMDSDRPSDRLFGVATIGMGVALIGHGVAFIVRDRQP
ncbi:hypothetical protein AB0L82_35460 [Nocardia sp. NPDC052001]|uniref:hypothetical protein n=1 Tax=Nocardia sp. NPDC052001 TaxID=3154853 RepID=UPI003427EBE8